MSRIEIRPIVNDDAPSFRACLDAVARERRYLAQVEAPSLARVQQFVSDSVAQGAAQYVAVHDGAVVGWCDIFPHWAHALRHVGTLGMGVATAFRGQGIGRRLLERTLEHACGQGIYRVTLEAREDNRAAIRLYESVGFQHEGRLPCAFYVDGVFHAAVLMAKLQGPALEASASSHVDTSPTHGQRVNRVLRGPRVTLRLAHDHDLPRLLAILREPAVARHWSQPDESFDRRELLSGDAVEHGECVTTFVITVHDETVGWIAACEQPHRDYRHAGIDLFVSTAHQGHGIGPEAIRLVCRWLFTERGHHRITIDPAADNLRAIRAYEQVGFRRVGVMRQYERGADGSYHDGLLLDLLPEDLQDA